MTGEFPAQMASKAEIVSIWWRYRAIKIPGAVGRYRVDSDLCFHDFKQTYYMLHDEPFNQYNRYIV